MERDNGLVRGHRRRAGSVTVIVSLVVMVVVVSVVRRTASIRIDLAVTRVWMINMILRYMLSMIRFVFVIVVVVLLVVIVSASGAHHAEIVRVSAAGSASVLSRRNKNVLGFCRVALFGSRLFWCGSLGYRGRVLLGVHSFDVSPVWLIISHGDETRGLVGLSSRFLFNGWFVSHLFWLVGLLAGHQCPSVAWGLGAARSDRSGTVTGTTVITGGFGDVHVSDRQQGVPTGLFLFCGYVYRFDVKVINAI